SGETPHDSNFSWVGYSDGDLVHELAEAYDGSWQPEDWARMLALTKQAPPHLAPTVAQELIVIDIQRRRAQNMTLPDIHSYLDRFPALAADQDWKNRVRAEWQEYAQP